MSAPSFPWAPRVILSGRNFRLPVRASGAQQLDLQAPDFQILDQRFCARDGAFYYYLKTPDKSGDYTIGATQQGRSAHLKIQVRSLDDLRRPQDYNGALWPRRWPLGKEWSSRKTRQTLQDLPLGSAPNTEVLQWWTSRDDATVWAQLPAAELPQAHYVNVHQGCPNCGTAIFSFHGFYPWKRRDLPCGICVQCPACGSSYPSNDPAAGNFTGGDYADDGFGYFDEEGHVFLFAAVHHRDQVIAFGSAVGVLTKHLRQNDFDAAIARRLGLLLLRYAAEVIYVAAVPQFRYGPSKEAEEPWEWGQTDWAAAADPLAALFRKGMLRYAIDVPIIAQDLALAYDTIWPFLRRDDELVERARTLGLALRQPADVIGLIEEMLACLLQCCLDGGGLSNLPRVSLSTLVLLRVLERADARDVMEWLYDRGPAKLRVFTTNNFFPDGTPPESIGGYNNTHTSGLFDLEYQLRQLRQDCPGAYPESLFPSLMADPRAARIVAAPYETTMLGKAMFGFGDGGSSGVQAGDMGGMPLYSPLAPETLERAAQYTGDDAVARIRDQVVSGVARRPGTTIHDGVGIAILRTGEAPERAALGVVYGDTTGHRHMDLLDVQLFAYERPFLSDLGYPQSWASVSYWEGNWATHNSMWGTVEGLGPLQLPYDTPWYFLKQIAGRGRLVRTLLTTGLQIVELEAERWAWDAAAQHWYRPGVKLRRLLGLVETEGEGVALVDLARICGGSEHWRVCRGLEGGFSAAQVGRKPLPGTVADARGERGQHEALPHPDYAGLACMDQVEALEGGSAWKGSWEFCREPGVHLDLYQLDASPSTQVLSARSTAVMAAPEESNYNYRTLLWKRRPGAGDPGTRVDLVFEPRCGPATLAKVGGIRASENASMASGVELTTSDGKQLEIYWAPEAGPRERTHFANGTELRGRLAAIVDGQIVACGATGVQVGGHSYDFEQACQQGRILSLERAACTIQVEGLQGVAAGDRLRINPAGRGHNYLVKTVIEMSPGRHQLELDVTSVLGRARVVAVKEYRVELDFYIMARSGNLHRTRLQRESDGAWAEIATAMNPDADRTVVRLRAPLPGLQPGDWVGAVDYAPGDIVAFEPLCSS